MKYLLLALVSCSSFGGGSKAPKDIKVYASQPFADWCTQEWCVGKTGAVRAQAKEVIPYDKTEGMIMMTSDDFTRLVEACPRN